MEAVTEDDIPKTQVCFGIKKIVNFKVGEGGQQMYKVKWEETWEPAETLVKCTSLIDEFWSFINKVKAKEEVAQQYRKRMIVEQTKNNTKDVDQNFYRMSDDDKADVQRLISQANATSVGGPLARLPGNMLMESTENNERSNLGTTPVKQKHSIATNQNLTHVSPVSSGALWQSSPAMQMQSSCPRSLNSMATEDQFNFNPPGRKRKLDMLENKGNCFSSIAKVEVDNSTEQKDIKQSSTDGKSISTASLKYLEGFTNPYVKIIVACKICNKEQSLKFSSNWYKHYMTHSDTKPHRCPHCPKSFIRGDQMRRHVQSKHSNLKVITMMPQYTHISPQHELKMSPDNIKGENYEC